MAQLQASNPEAFATTIALLCQHQLQDCTSLALVPAGLSAEDEQIKTLQAELQTQLPKATLMVCTNLLEAERCQKQLLITATGAPSRRDLAELRQQLDLQGKAPLGWLLLEGDDA